uniref:Secretory carrier-associated membrane protein n=1 Tax=Parascaris equorum TaxID=6256 RepID=A0A914RKD0_PAREQ
SYWTELPTFRILRIDVLCCLIQHSDSFKWIRFYRLELVWHSALFFMLFGGGGVGIFLLAIIQLLLFSPCSFLFWFRPVYKYACGWANAVETFHNIEACHYIFKRYLIFSMYFCWVFEVQRRHMANTSFAVKRNERIRYM